MFNLFSNDNTDFNYLLESAGHDILINNQPARAVITNPRLNVIIDYDDRHISTTTPIKRGDLIEWNGNKYFIITETVAPRHSKYKSMMRNCNYSIKFIIGGDLYECISIIESRSLDTDTGQYITMPTGKIIVTLQDNEITDNIVLSQRFIKMGFPWKIVGIDKSKKGLIKLTCDIDTILPNDDMENEIADADQLVQYVVKINNNDATLNLGQTLQLDVTVTANGQVVNENVLFESSDPTIASVDENGLVTAHEEGNVTITARLERNPDIYDTISLTVEEVIEDNYSIVISGADQIRYGQSQTYTVQVFNNGIEVDENVRFELYADDQTSTTTIASITSQDGKSCVIKNNNANTGYVQLKAILEIDDSVIEWKRIQMRSVF